MADRVSDIFKRPGCRLVNLQSGGSFKVPTALFRVYPLKAGDEIEVSSYLSLLRASENRHALEQAVRMLEQRDRSEAELLGRLRDAGYSEASAEAARAKLAGAGYLNDRRYAATLLERLGKKYGAIRLRRELQTKGVKQEIIAELLEETEPESQMASALTQARKALRGKTGDASTLYRRAYGALARRGYPPDVVRAALAEALGEMEQGQSDA